MKKEGYDAATAAAVTAASATIGPIIPPSLPMIVYGVAAETSIGSLFIAGIIPGLLMTAALMVMVRHLAIRRNLPRHPFEGARALWVAFRRAFWALMAPVVLFGGLLSGVFTPTEAAAVAVTYALVLGLVRLPRIPARRPAAADPRHGRDYRRGDGAGDDGVAAGLLHLGVAAAAGVRRDADGADDESARLPADRQPAAAGRRLLHGGAGGDAGADSDPRAAGAGAGDRPGAVRSGVRAQPDDRHDHAAGGRRPLRDRQGRGRAVRGHRQSDAAVSWCRCSWCWR